LIFLQKRIAIVIMAILSLTSRRLRHPNDPAEGNLLTGRQNGLLRCFLRPWPVTIPAIIIAILYLGSLPTIVLFKFRVNINLRLGNRKQVMFRQKDPCLIRYYLIKHRKAGSITVNIKPCSGKLLRSWPCI